MDTEFFEGHGREDSDQDLDAFDAPNLSAQEYAEHTANQTASAFAATKMFEVVEVKANIAQVSLLGRVKGERVAEFVDTVVTPVLKAIDASPECEGHVCQQYLLKNGRTKYAWTISFAANDLRAAAHAICNAITPAIPKLEVMESPLVGAPAPKGSLGKGGRRGATPVR